MLAGVGRFNRTALGFNVSFSGISTAGCCRDNVKGYMSASLLSCFGTVCQFSNVYHFHICSVLCSQYSGEHPGHGKYYLGTIES